MWIEPKYEIFIEILFSKQNAKLFFPTSYSVVWSIKKMLYTWWLINNSWEVLKLGKCEIVAADPVPRGAPFPVHGWQASPFILMWQEGGERSPESCFKGTHLHEGSAVMTSPPPRGLLPNTITLALGCNVGILGRLHIQSVLPYKPFDLFKLFG